MIGDKGGVEDFCFKNMYPLFLVDMLFIGMCKKYMFYLYRGIDMKGELIRRFMVYPFMHSLS